MIDSSSKLRGKTCTTVILDEGPYSPTPRGCLAVWDDEILSRPEKKPFFGFLIKERIGIGAYNPFALQVLEINMCPEGCLSVSECEILLRGDPFC